MRVNNKRSHFKPIWPCLLALVLVASSCGTGDQAGSPLTSPDDQKNTEEPARAYVIQIEPVEGSIISFASNLTSTAVFDESGFEHLRNDLGAWYNKAETVNTDLDDVDWEAEFVLMTVFDACNLDRATLAISSDGTSVGWEQQDKDVDCESLFPHVALFVVPLSVDTRATTVTFGPDDLPELVGGYPIEAITPVQLGGIKPAGVYPAGGDQPTEGAFFFEQYGNDEYEFLSEIVGEGEDGDADVPGLEAQTGARDEATESLLLVVQRACKATDFELVATANGFTHTMWVDPADCASASLHAIVYIVPKMRADGFTYSADAQPEIQFETIKES